MYYAGGCSAVHVFYTQYDLKMLQSLAILDIVWAEFGRCQVGW